MYESRYLGEILMFLFIAFFTVFAVFGGASEHISYQFYDDAIHTVRYRGCIHIFAMQ